MGMFDQTIQKLGQGLDVAAYRNGQITNNIANVDTPHYGAQRTTFKQILNHMEGPFTAKRTHTRHLPFSKDNILFRMDHKKAIFNHNGNPVDIDKEMAHLAENQIYYRSLIDRLTGKFGLLHTVINGGR